MTTATNIQGVRSQANANNGGAAKDISKMLTSVIMGMAAVFNGNSSAEIPVRPIFGVNDYPF